MDKIGHAEQLDKQRPEAENEREERQEHGKAVDQFKFKLHNAQPDKSIDDMIKEINQAVLDLEKDKQGPAAAALRSVARNIRDLKDVKKFKDLSQRLGGASTQDKLKQAMEGYKREYDDAFKLIIQRKEPDKGKEQEQEQGKSRKDPELGAFVPGQGRSRDDGDANLSWSRPKRSRSISRPSF